MDPKLLAALYPGLVEELEKDLPGPPDETGGEPRVEATPSGHPTLLVAGRHVHSPRDPVREAGRLVESLHASARSPSGEAGTAPIVILGFGLGYSAEAAARAAPGRPLIIVEKRKETLRLALKVRDLESLLAKNRLVFVLGGNGNAAIQNALDLFKAAPEIIRNRALMAADEEWYAVVEQGINAWLNRDKVNQATLRRFGRRWVRNLARNMEAIRDLPGISRLRGILAVESAGNPESGSGIPVFLAAAGPSLDGAGPLLGEIRKRCVVVAVDTSLRFMLDRGLDPDFAVVVDPQYWNFRHLDRCKAARTWLIAESAVYPAVLRRQFRGTFLCRSQFPLGCFIEDRVDPKGALGAGGSVATSAWDFARVLGAPAVWIAGLDLAFPGLKTHFRGALFETRSHAESDRFVPAETWSLRALRDGRPFLAASADGGQVLTDQRLSLYASWFAANFRKYPAFRSYRLVSTRHSSELCSEHSSGIAIPGLESAGPEALLELPERREEIDGLLEGIYARIAEDFRLTAGEREQSYRAARLRLMDGLRTVAGEAAEAAALARNSLRRFEQGADQAARKEFILRKLDRTLRSITTSDVKEVAGFLFPSQEEFTAEDEGRSGEPFIRYLESSGRIYQALAEAASYQLEVLAARRLSA
ncbi:MAG: DUF115 domain-containing protein [Treponema sp.]|jgi:hypothetical protein|nr:DUF115 domain-containing protein [Treponema sp.]